MGPSLSKQGPGYIQDSGLSNEVRAALKEVETFYIPKRSLKRKKGFEVGEGGFGDVFLAQLKDPNRKLIDVAVKQLRPVGATVARTRLALHLARELRVWAKLNHPNVLALQGFHLSDDLMVAQFVSIYMAHGNVSQYIKDRDPGTKTRFKFVKEITAGMTYLHEYNPPICHGDLKPANVLISDNVDAVLCDFGLAAFVDGPSGMTTTQAVKGSVRYMGPEFFLGNEETSKRTLSSDVWAWACTTYEIVVELKPYNDCTREQTVAALLQGVGPGSMNEMRRRIPQDGTWPEKVLQMIDHCWSFDPSRRPKMKDLSDACEAPPSEAIDLNGGATVSADGSSPLAKRAATLGSDVSTLAPGQPFLSGSTLPTSQILKPLASASNILLEPGVYHISFLLDEENGTSQYLCQTSSEVPISLSTGNGDSQAEQWVFTLKPGTATQYAISNILSGRYLGVIDGRVEATSNIEWWTLGGDAMGFTIAVNDVSLAPGTGSDDVEVIMEDGSSTSARWSITPTAEKTYGPYLIKHKETQNYLGLKDGDYSDETPALGFRETVRRKADPSFHWRVIPTSGRGRNLVRIQNVASGTCLMSYGGPVDGAVQISGWADARHGWVAQPAPEEPTARIFYVEGSRDVAELYAGDRRDGTNAVIWPFKAGNPRQVWYLEPIRS